MIDRDDQCPNRGPGLTHIQDGSPKCVFCGVRVGRRVHTTSSRRYCAWRGCVEVLTDEWDHCPNHHALMAQHDASHLTEGHSNSIDGCPRC